MLVLSRKTNESVMIGDHIRVTVVGIRHDSVRLGVSAPTDICILREELTDAYDLPLSAPRGALGDQILRLGSFARPVPPRATVVLTRRRGESIVIQTLIRLTLMEIRGDRIRLGIVSPAEIPIHRREVYEAIHGPISEAVPARLPEEDGFLQAIRANPDDVASRLIFADWLEERGDPRGEFIRLQCTRAALSASEDHDEELRAREELLWQQHGATWRSGLPRILRYAGFERGFVESASLTVNEFLVHAAAIFAATPFRRLRVRRAWDDTAQTVGRLAASPFLVRLQTLDLSDLELGDEQTLVLAASPHVHALGELILQGNHVGDAGAAGLADAALLANLSTLDLSYNRIGEPGAHALAASPHFPRLRSLRLTKNPLNAESRAVLRHRFGEHVSF